MGRTKYWRGSTSPVWHMGLQRFLDWGDSADSDDVDKDDDRWTSKDPDPKNLIEHDDEARHGATAADSAPPTETKDTAGKAGSSNAPKGGDGS